MKILTKMNLNVKFKVKAENVDIVWLLVFPRAFGRMLTHVSVALNSELVCRLFKSEETLYFPFAL